MLNPWNNQAPPPPPPDFGPRWDIYLPLSVISLKDAIALTCNINPPDIYIVQRPFEFNYRLSIALQCIEKDPAVFEIIQSNINPELTEVTLSSISRFAKIEGWRIPTELLALDGSSISLSNTLHKESPWLVPHPGDPTGKQPWYIPARYFARLYVKDNPLLATDRVRLSKKIAEVLPTIGIYKRGGILSLDAATILKALNKINLG